MRTLNPICGSFSSLANPILAALLITPLCGGQRFSTSTISKIFDTNIPRPRL